MSNFSENDVPKVRQKLEKTLELEKIRSKFTSNSEVEKYRLNAYSLMPFVLAGVAIASRNMEIAAVYYLARQLARINVLALAEYLAEDFGVKLFPLSF